VTATRKAGRGRAAVCDIDEPGCQALCERLREAALPIALDVTDPEDWERAAGKAWEAFGGVDVLVNNAGRAIGGKCHEVSLKDHREMIEVNLFGVINGIHTLVRRFLKQGSGHIVNVGSFAAFSHHQVLGVTAPLNMRYAHLLIPVIWSLRIHPSV